jgi:hypothetical protein
MPGRLRVGRVLLTTGLIHVMGVAMGEHARGVTDQHGRVPVTVDMRVRVYPGTDAEGRGVVVDDYGETAGHAVDIGGNRFVDPARRWAVLLDTGALVFTDSHNIVPE